MYIDMIREKAPPDLLKIVNYGCRTDFSQKNCTRRQYAVACTNTCSSCRPDQFSCEQISCSDG